jgi:hypothetical protein
MSNQINLNADELKNFITHIVDNNRYLQENKKIPVACAIEGEAGIGKTSVILQLGEELGLNVVKVNLAQIEEIGDLTGFPMKEFEMIKKGEPDNLIKWVPESIMNTYIQAKYIPSGRKRMVHAAPEWIEGKKEGGILILDDYTRADSRFLQACMELIDRQKYYSWELPKDWHIVLTTNPDNGDYLVNSIDVAQKTRFITCNLDFDIDCWGRWAETENIDSRCINFLLLHPELVSKSTNARSITTFFNSISSFEKFEDNLPMIQMIGEGSVGPEFTTLFNMFINNKLDKLVAPLTVLKDKEWASVKAKLMAAVYDGSEYRADIASIMGTRILNTAITYSQNNTINDTFITRIKSLINDEDIFSTDIKYYVIRGIVNGNKTKFQKLLMDPDIVKMTIQ